MQCVGPFRKPLTSWAEDVIVNVVGKTVLYFYDILIFDIQAIGGKDLQVIVFRSLLLVKISIFLPSFSKVLGSGVITKNFLSKDNFVTELCCSFRHFSECLLKLDFL